MKIGGQLWLTPNWDKSYRCPVSSGPKFQGPYVGAFCHGGRVRVGGHIDSFQFQHPFRAAICLRCGVKVFPLAFNWLHPTWLAFTARHSVRWSWDGGILYRLVRRPVWRILDRAHALMGRA